MKERVRHRVKGRASVIARAQLREPQHFSNSASACAGESEFNRLSLVFKASDNHKVTKTRKPGVFVFFVPLCLSLDGSKDSQPTHPAIRKNIEAHVRNRTGVHHFVKEVPRVGLQLRARQHRLPDKFRVLHCLERQANGVTAFEGTALGKFPLK